MHKFLKISDQFKKFSHRIQPCKYKIPNNNNGTILHYFINDVRHQPRHFLSFSKFSSKLLHTQNFYSCRRYLSQKPEENFRKIFTNTLKVNLSIVYYASAVTVLVLGLSYAAVPLYKVFCRATGYGGAVTIQREGDIIENMDIVNDRFLKVSFFADTAAKMRWNFKPQQDHVIINPGETVLAFYTANNPTDKPVVGVSTYNIIPFEAAPYFNKIQCFCFEEQMLNPHEEVDMPVFFYVSPEFDDDPKMENVDEITLSYTFFEVKDGMNLLLQNK